MGDKEMRVITCSAPVNIAVIKYCKSVVYCTHSVYLTNPETTIIRTGPLPRFYILGSVGGVKGHNIGGKFENIHLVFLHSHLC